MTVSQEHPEEFANEEEDDEEADKEVKCSGLFYPSIYNLPIFSSHYTILSIIRSHVQAGMDKTYILFGVVQFVFCLFRGLLILKES